MLRRPAPSRPCGAGTRPCWRASPSRRGGRSSCRRPRPSRPRCPARRATRPPWHAACSRPRRKTPRAAWPWARSRGCPPGGRGSPPCRSGPPRHKDGTRARRYSTSMAPSLPIALFWLHVSGYAARVSLYVDWKRSLSAHGSNDHSDRLCRHHWRRSFQGYSHPQIDRDDKGT